ncbi:hypothetical protein ACLKA7_001541 [Drosophila subpalustris]
MPTTVKLHLIEEAQAVDSELIESLHCDVSPGYVRPYVPNTLRNKIFSFFHGLSDPSGRSTLQQISHQLVQELLALSTC